MVTVREAGLMLALLGGVGVTTYCVTAIAPPPEHYEALEPFSDSMMALLSLGICAPYVVSVLDAWPVRRASLVLTWRVLAQAILQVGGPFTMSVFDIWGLIATGLAAACMGQLDRNFVKSRWSARRSGVAGA